VDPAVYSRRTYQSPWGAEWILRFFRPARKRIAPANGKPYPVDLRLLRLFHPVYKRMADRAKEKRSGRRARRSQPGRTADMQADRSPLDDPAGRMIIRRGKQALLTRMLESLHAFRG
jgi:hypothetical protein